MTKKVSKQDTHQSVHSDFPSCDTHHQTPWRRLDYSFSDRYEHVGHQRKFKEKLINTSILLPPLLNPSLCRFSALEARHKVISDGPRLSLGDTLKLGALGTIHCKVAASRSLQHDLNPRVPFCNFLECLVCPAHLLHVRVYMFPRVNSSELPSVPHEISTKDSPILLCHFLQLYQTREVPL